MHKGLVMQKLIISQTVHTPEIQLSPEENIFIIRGTSAPEDVRAIYYPVVEYLRSLIDEIIFGNVNIFSNDNPLNFKIDLEYFNSSSAKFLYDIFLELKRLLDFGLKVIVEWYYDHQDIDLKEAGSDLALLAEMEFIYIPKFK